MPTENVRPIPGNEYPLSYGQRALWFLQQLSPRNTAYNFVFCARITTPLDAAALRSAFGSLLERHSSLRTTYAMREGRPVQRIQNEVDLCFDEVDAREWDFGEVARRLAEAAYRPFDLERGPLLRVSLYARPAGEHYLLLAAHHIAIDFRSLEVLLFELGELYPAAAAGKAPPLPPVATRYADYVRWQEQLLASDEGGRLWSYWSRQLAGAPPALDLPIDHPRPALQTYHGASHTLRLDAGLVGRLKDLSQSRQASLGSTLLAAYQVLLHGYSGQPDILVGWPAMGRHQEFANLVGYLVNPVVIRTDLSGDPPFDELLSRVHETFMRAWEHQDYPFALLVERLQPVRDPGRSPWFQTLIAHYELDDRGILPLLFGGSDVQVNLGGLELRPFVIDQRAAMLDLSLIMIEAGNSLTGYWQYNTDLFDAPTIARMAERFQTLLENIAAGPGRRISALRSRSPHKTEAKTHASLPLTGPRPTEAPAGMMDFSLFYFASDDSQLTRNKYELLLEGAKFGDRHGFPAVWTPERHFHAFGGLYPNPAVTSAAIAAVTERIQIRAGSVVLPLHHPARVAEEWSVVDNLSNGRVAVAFASGWHAKDFILAPENYSQRREVMARSIEEVRRLWRGKALSFPDPSGNMQSVEIWPRPIQAELPIWLSAFGSPDTFRLAGQIGANVLTHLVGQSLEELAHKIRIYRNSRAERGFDPDGGSVAVMLHTFIAEDIDDVRNTVRKPFLAYLKSSVDLASSFKKSPAEGVDAVEYTEAEIDAYLDIAFERYFKSSALFGTPDTCDDMINQLLTAGVNEIACLIDFGIDSARVLASLEYLKLVRDRARRTGFAPRAARQPVSTAQEPDLEPVQHRVEARRNSPMRQLALQKKRGVKTATEDGG